MDRLCPNAVDLPSLKKMKKNKISIFFLSFIALLNPIGASESSYAAFDFPWESLDFEHSYPQFSLKSIVASYTCPTYVPADIWQKLSPYFLPDDHPIKGKLDRIFSASRVSLDPYTLKKAGFLTPNPRNHSRTIVSKHPQLKGYLVKLFTDVQKDKSDSQQLHKRIRGAVHTWKAIQAHGYQRYFKVPRKWIYPLPEHPAPPAEYLSNRKNFILVVEDMDIFQKKKNNKQWKSAVVTPERLNAIYTILQEVGLDDSMRAFNLPFCADGKQAFIDTERYHHWPIKMEVMLQYLSKPMKRHWNHLIIKGGPK